MKRWSAATRMAAGLAVAFLVGCGPTKPAGLTASPGIAGEGAPVTVMYVRSGCSFCQEAREFFAARGLPVRERNVVDDRGALVEMLDIHVRRFPDREPLVPLIVIGDQVVSGFDPQEVEAALAAARRKPESGRGP